MSLTTGPLLPYIFSKEIKHVQQNYQTLLHLQNVCNSFFLRSEIFVPLTTVVTSPPLVTGNTFSFKHFRTEKSKQPIITTAKQHSLKFCNSVEKETEIFSNNVSHYQPVLACKDLAKVHPSH